MADPKHSEGFENRLLYKLGRSRITDALLTVYFIGITLAGLIGLGWIRGWGNVDGATLTGQIEGSQVSFYFSWASVAIGMAGIMARLFHSRMGEFYAVIGVSILTIINGIILLPDYPQTAMRLIVAPAMMVPYAWMRLGVTMSRGEVNALHRVMTRGTKGRTE